MRENLTDFVASRNDKPPISVSLHPDKIVAVKTFRRREVSDYKTLIGYVENHVCSPIIYRESLRNKANFLSAGWIGLDIDSNVTLADAIDLLKELHVSCIVGTTQNHQREKKTPGGKLLPACDRFRILIEMSTECTDITLFEYNVMSWIKTFRADASAKDGARLFKPCKVVFQQEDLPQDWLPFPPGYKSQTERVEMHHKQMEAYRKRGAIPQWILHAQRFGVPPGGGGEPGRHHTCYKIAATLTELGFSANDIATFLCAGPLIDIGADDVRRQVEYGARAAIEHANERIRILRQHD